MNEPRTPEDQRLWLLEQVNSRFRNDRTPLRNLFWFFAILALAGLVVFFRPGLH